MENVAVHVRSGSRRGGFVGGERVRVRGEGRRGEGGGWEGYYGAGCWLWQVDSVCSIFELVTVKLWSSVPDF